MATKPTAMDVSIAAAEYVLSDEPPLYSELDCYKFVRQCVRDNGGEMKYSGSNDVYRNGVTMLVPLKEAMDRDLLKSGWALFIVEPYSATTPEQYLADGRQDATHMGLFTDMYVTRRDGTEHYVEVAHSSASRGMVAASTLKNAWNWAGMLKDVDYSASGWEPGLPEFDENGEIVDEIGNKPVAPAQAVLEPHTAIVVSDTLRARKSLSTRSSGNVVMQMLRGRVLTDIRTGYWFDSGEPAISGMIAGTKHPRVYAAAESLRTAERYLRVNDTDERVTL